MGGRIEFAVKALIFNNDKILLLKKSDKEDVNPNDWDIPGGRVKYLEKPEQALLREIYEETCLNVS